MLALAIHPLAAELRINELVADSKFGISDEEGELSDWIEIYNGGERSVSLQGWALTDNPERVQKWMFPDVAMAPGEYLAILASGKDRIDGERLHTNFKLDREGEFLALTNPEGVFVSAFSPMFPKVTSGVSYGFDETLGAYRGWSLATPGVQNQEEPDFGPSLVFPERRSLLAEEATDFVVSVQVVPSGLPVQSVRLVYRVLHKTEVKVVLNDDGIAPDEVAEDGRYTGDIPARTIFGVRFRGGDLLRWRFEATDSEGKDSRLPRQREDVSSQAEYFGTIVEDPAIESELPVLHWFTDSPEAAASTGGGRASVYFEGRFYDNVFVKRRGQSGAIGWPKPKLKFDFNPRDHFIYDPERRRVEEFNLQSHFNDASFMRENVAFAFFNKIGTPASDTRHWHVRLNGDFYGLFSYVEQVDKDFLRQQGLDPDGVLYKANGFPATLARGVTRALYQKETRKEEPYDDLVAFVEGINGANRSNYIMDHVNLPAMANEMAGQSLIRNADRLTKNYYMFLDPMTDRWQRFPWDMDGAFSTSAGLANENYASPLYGDSEHTQAPNQKIYQNFLLDAILDHRLSRQMYLRRLRTLIDTYLTEDFVYFTSQVDEHLALIRPDAVLDVDVWNTGNIVSGVNTLKEAAWSLRRRELLETFGKNLIPESQTMGLELVIGEVEASPEDPEAEYFQIINPHREAIDMSGWELSGAVSMTFSPGTVLPAKGNVFNPDDGRMIVVRDVRAFRDRTDGPHGDQGLFYVGPYDGKLSADGETILLHDGAGRLIVEHTYAGVGNTYASWVKETFAEEAQEDAAIIDSAADPFGLGVSNLYRYAFGEGPDVQVDSTTSLSYRRVASASDLRFVVEASEDLTDWRVKEGAQEGRVESAEGFERVRILVRPSRGQYFRVRVILSL